MSALKVIEKAALSLPGDQLRQLVVVLAAEVDRAPASSQPISSGNEAALPSSLHPALLPMVGIIPQSAEADEIHFYRLLKHS